MNKITSENYVVGVLRTDSPVTPEMIARFSQPETIRLIHATLGMVTEAAELADMLKKHLFYGRPLDMVNAAEEVGDNLWYVGLAIDVLHTTMNDILTMNHEKLRLRYPEKFTEFHAENRNLTAERVLLEDSRPCTFDSTCAVDNCHLPVNRCDRYRPLVGPLIDADKEKAARQITDTNPSPCARDCACNNHA